MFLQSPAKSLSAVHSTRGQSASNADSVDMQGADRDTGTLSSHPSSGGIATLLSRLLSHFAFALTVSYPPNHKDQNVEAGMKMDRLLYSCGSL